MSEKDAPTEHIMDTGPESRVEHQSETNLLPETLKYKGMVIAIVNKRPDIAKLVENGEVTIVNTVEEVDINKGKMTIEQYCGRFNLEENITETEETKTDK